MGHQAQAKALQAVSSQAEVTGLLLLPKVCVCLGHSFLEMKLVGTNGFTPKNPTKFRIV